ncbi:hypothetical protein N864_04035 [Intrasporangium chromatireducens Q5-1]|uniref:Lipoprotein n=1 Tax=Intrasporangium chromatireducens Q5-1 TaxID=584657 RepID=W9GNV3_9MICO|nr:hypothetical protein [Intrasporangium chromatireducens]EWT05544.1 hypothetical protein N864_04035 [Intrasporangium chromatireducens Q5-1]
MRAHSTTLRAAGAVLLGLTLVAGLGACGQPAAPRAAGPTTIHVEIQPTIAPLDPTALDTDGPNPSAAVEDDHLFDASDALSDAKCEPQGDSWSFSGQLTNKNAAPETYTVGVTLLKTADMSEETTKEITVTVQPGQSAPVEAKDFHTAPAKGLTCLTGVTVKGQ